MRVTKADEYEEDGGRMESQSVPISHHLSLMQMTIVDLVHIQTVPSSYGVREE